MKALMIQSMFLALALVSVDAQANPAQKLTEQARAQIARLQQSHRMSLRDDQPTTQPTPQPMPTPQPIRQAHFRAHVQKQTFQQLPNGNYGFQMSEVCSGEGIMNVYDVRNEPQFALDNGDFSRLVCDSTLGGKPVKVNVGGFVALAKEKIIDQDEEFKMAVPALLVNDGTVPGQQVLNVISGMGSKDLNARSFIGFLQPMPTFQCSVEAAPAPSPNPPSVSLRSGPTCTASMNEYFTANIEIED